MVKEIPVIIFDVHPEETEGSCREAGLQARDGRDDGMRGSTNRDEDACLY